MPTAALFAIIILSVLCIALAGLLVFRRAMGLPRAGIRAKSGGDLTELNTVLDSITDALCIIDRSFRITYSNKRYRKAAGGEDFCYAALFKRTEPCEECPARETFETGRETRRKKTAQLRSEPGEKKQLEISTYPLADASGTALRVIESIRDTTQEAAMLAELIRSEKLAGIGVMTTGIAHEMNNALSGISGTASNLLTMPEKYGLNDKGQSRVYSIMDATTRATGVMKNLLQFSSPLQEETRVMVNVRQLLKRVLTTAYAQEAPDIDRQLRFEDGLPLISADFSKMELVFMNVISNAIRSIQQKKKACAAAGEPYRGSLMVYVRKGDDSLLITFTDNGMGIKRELWHRIFDPFFSVWPDGNKTGLGLSTAMRIVEEHSGRMFFDSNERETTFSVRLPLNPARLKTYMEANKPCP